jgi:hypothetical protein
VLTRFRLSPAGGIRSWMIAAPDRPRLKSSTSLVIGKPKFSPNFFE